MRHRYIGAFTILLTVGLLFLLSNFYLLSWMNFATTLLFWPIILILLGLYILFKGRKITYIITAINGFFVGLVLFSLLVVYSKSLPFLPKINVHKQSKVNPSINFTSSKDNAVKDIDRANLVFKSEKGDFYLRGTTNALTEYDTKTTFGEYIYTQSEKNGIVTVDIRFDSERFPWKIISEKNSLDLKLNPKPKWNIDFDISSSTLDADLGYYIVKNLQLRLVRASSATINIEHGTIDNDLKINLDVSTSRMYIKVDKDIGIRVTVDSILSQTDLVGLTKLDNNIYETEDFEQKTKKIYIEGKINLSTLKLVRS